MCSSPVPSGGMNDGVQGLQLEAVQELVPGMAASFPGSAVVGNIVNVAAGAAASVPDAGVLSAGPSTTSDGYVPYST